MKHVLIVEDNADLRKMLITFLKSEGHDVKAAATAAEALDLVEGDGIEIAVIDIGLPDYDRWELMRRISQLDKHIVGIAMSAMPKPMVAAKSEKAGFVRHIEKPVDLMWLPELIGAM